ncbi:MAG TPA: hypothetical protein VMH28_09030 [Candidatus Acidoferrales bacterium]|nr:hypothetical protein [Candidatus Acidoferrales bacterium]
MRKSTATGALALWAIATLGYAQETVNGGITVLGPLRSNGSMAAVDFTAAGSTSPVKSGTLASRPGICAVGQMYFATDATPGQNLSYCTAPGTWTSNSASAGAGPCQLASALGFALNGSDETSLLNTTLTAFYTAGGGCLAINAGKTLRADGQIVLPNSGLPNLIQPTYRFTSAGNAGGWADSSTSASGGVLDLRFHGDSSHPEYGNGPKLVTIGSGNVIFDNLTITSGAGSADCATYLMTTASMLMVHNVTFWGQHGLTSACNDAVVLGGTAWNNAAPAGTLADHFAGYGTVIRDNRFLGMARAVWARSAVNAVTIDANFIMGGNSVNPVGNAIDIVGYNGSLTDASRGNTISNNVIELGGQGSDKLYTCGIHLQYANQNQLFGNSFWDGGGNTYAFCGDGTAIQNNVERTNFIDVTGTRFLNATWSANNYMPWRTIPFFFDGGGQPLASNITRCGRVPFGGVINQFSMAADQPGSATVTVKAAALGSYAGAGSASDISNGGETMTGVAAKQDSTLAGWSYTSGGSLLQPNSMVCFTLTGASGITWLAGDLQVWEGR